MGTGLALALGAFLDGIPEQLVLGIGLAGGEGVGIGLLVAICVLTSAVGYGIADVTSGELRAVIDGFAVATALSSLS